MGNFFLNTSIPIRPLPPVDDPFYIKDKDTTDTLLLDANVMLKLTRKSREEISEKVRNNADLWRMIRTKITYNSKHGKFSTTLGLLEINILLTDISEDSLECAYTEIVEILNAHRYKACINPENNTYIDIAW